MPAVSTARPRGRGWLVHSDAQARSTLDRMRRGVRRAITDHDFVFFARDVIARLGTDARNQQALAQAVHDFTARAVVFMRDPAGIEDLTPPQTHARLLRAQGWVYGDCDDAATLSAALFLAVGGQSATFTIRAFWKPNSPFQHVFTTLYPQGGTPIVVDTTRDAQKLPPTPTRQLTVRV